MGQREEIPPDTLLGGKIRLIKRIGRGGMGDVWVARNEATEAELAVKTLQRAERSPTHDERFRREARLSATITHRNVVRVFDLIDEPDGTLGLVMELLRGGTLEQIMKERGPLPTAQAIAVAIAVLSAMHHFHQKGIIHRDMKPANVFFAVEPDGHVIPKVLDFGIAKLPAAGSALTIDGSVLGTPHYMSPEQIRGQVDIDGRSDMFSFAVVLYEMLTGVRLFQRDTASASLASVLEHEVDPDPRIEPRIWVALTRALAKRPYERFASCQELAEALRSSVSLSDAELAQSLQELRPRSDLTNTTSSTSVAVSTENPDRRPARTRHALVFGALGGVVVAALGFVFLFGRTTPPLALVPVQSAQVGTPSAVPTTSAAEANVDPAEPSSSATTEGSVSSKPPASATPPRPTAVRKPPLAPSGDRHGVPKPRGSVATTPGF